MAGRWRGASVFPSAMFEGDPFDGGRVGEVLVSWGLCLSLSGVPGRRVSGLRGSILNPLFAIRLRQGRLLGVTMARIAGSVSLFPQCILLRVAPFAHWGRGRQACLKGQA